jgi:hypothetical protein
VDIRLITLAATALLVTTEKVAARFAVCPLSERRYQANTIASGDQGTKHNKTSST